MAFVYQGIQRGLYLNNTIVARADHHLTTDAAVGTGRARPFCRRAKSDDAFIFDRPSRTGIRAGATTHARTLQQRCAGIRNNARGVGTVRNAPGELALNFFADSNAAKAMDAP